MAKRMVIYCAEIKVKWTNTKERKRNKLDKYIIKEHVLVQWVKEKEWKGSPHMSGHTQTVKVLWRYYLWFIEPSADV